MKKNDKKDANVKSGIRIKAIDIVIIILIILSLVGVYFRYNILDELTSKRNIKDYYVSFEITDIKNTTTTYFNVGDKIVFAEDGSEFGVLTTATPNVNNALFVDVCYLPYIPSEGGTVVEVPYPEGTRSNAYGRLICKGSYTNESGFLLNGTRPITPGQSIEIQTEKVSVTIKITDKITEVTAS